MTTLITKRIDCPDCDGGRRGACDSCDGAGTIAEMVAADYVPTALDKYHASLEAAIDRVDAAHDRIAELEQALADAEATIEHLRGSLARTQTWLTEASAENTELRTKVHERDVWLNAAAGTIERYGAKYGPLS